MTRIESDPIDRDERLGEAIEAFLALAEEGSTPDPDEFAGRYPDLSDDLREALDGLALVHGLVGGPAGPGRSLEAGRRVGGYRIVRELGRGGMGVVYEAVHVDLDRPVALKVLGTHAAPDSNGRRRFLNEAKTAAGLHHTHIVPVFDVGQVGGLCYYAMQRIEGSGLDRVLKAMRRDRSLGAGSGSHRPARTGSRTTAHSPSGGADAEDLGLSISGLGGTASWHAGSGGSSGPSRSALRPAGEDEGTPFDPPRGSAYYRWVAQVGRQAAEALAYAHRRGVIHRDVKPSNLLVEARGSIWVADFGLARRLADPGLTHTDSLLGTPRYMSPEQAKSGPIDGRTDIYSLGATLYELLTLRPPFEGRTAAELVQQILHREPTPPRKSDPRIPRDLETIVLKAMAKRPADRYETASDLADDLGRFLDFEPVKARRIGPAGRAWRFARRHPSLAAVTATSLAVIVAVASWAHLNVVYQRNETQVALKQTQDANRHLDAERRTADAERRKAEAAYRQALWHEAETIQLSTIPDRRKKGLEKIKEAAALGPEAGLRVGLRDEAVKFLALRDVEPGAVLPVGRTEALAFPSGGGRIASLSEDRTELVLSDPQGVEPERRITIQVGPSDHDRPGHGPRIRDGLRFPLGNRLAPVGDLLAAVWPDGRGLSLIRPETGSHVDGLRTEGWRQIESVFGSPGGRFLVTLERQEGRVGPTFRAVLWDPARGGNAVRTLVEPVDNVEGPFRVPLIGLSPDGRSIATVARSGGPQGVGAEPVSTVTLWDAETGEPRGTPEEIPGFVTALALGPDDLMAAAISDGSIRLWDGKTGKVMPGLYHPQSWVHLLRFSPDGKLLALAGWGSGIELWDSATHTPVATMRTREPVADLSFSSDGRTLAAAFGEKISLWGVVDPFGLVRLSGFSVRPSSLAFGPDGVLAMANWGRGVRLWHPDRCPTSARTLDDVGALSVAFAEGGLIAADSEALSRIRPADAEILSRLVLRPSPFDLPVLAGAGVMSQPVEALRRAGSRGWERRPAISTCRGGRLVFLAQGPELFAWSDAEPDSVRRLPRIDAQPGRGGRGGRPSPKVEALAAAPDGRRLYQTREFEGELLAWDLGQDLEPKPLGWSRRFRDVSSLALSPDGRTLALGGRDGSIRLVDTSRGAVAGTLPPEVEGDGPIMSLAFDPDGSTLAVGLPHGRIALWSMAAPGRPSPIVHLPGHDSGVTSLAFDGDGRRLASSDDKVVQVWDLGRVRTRLEDLGLGW